MIRERRTTHIGIVAFTENGKKISVGMQRLGQLHYRPSAEGEHWGWSRGSALVPPQPEPQSTRGHPLSQLWAAIQTGDSPLWCSGTPQQAPVRAHAGAGDTTAGTHLSTFEALGPCIGVSTYWGPGPHARQPHKHTPGPTTLHWTLV